MCARDLDIVGLVNLEEWQRMQDYFAEVLEVSLRTFARDGNLLTKISRPSQLCSVVSPHSPAYDDFCGRCIFNKEDKGLPEIRQDSKVECLLGQDLFVVPIAAVGNGIGAYVVIGPLILNKRKEIAEDAETAERLGMDLSELVDALVEVSVFSYSKMYHVNKLIKEVFSHIAQSGYHKKRLGEMVPEIKRMDPLMSRYVEEKVLNSLLNVCTMALNADSGSVMTLDKKTRTLHVKAASRLAEEDQEAISHAEVKIGEGIAGIAAVNAQPIILPQDQEKGGLSERMKRKYIKSSMIVPFSRATQPLIGGPGEQEREVYGVVNLNIVRREQKFSKKDIAFVSELVNLASTALAPVQEPNNNDISQSND